MTGEWIAGVDEAGRGALVGPVVVAAVMLPPDHALDGLTDSKCLSAKRRESFAGRIRECAVAWAVIRVGSSRIDAVNILNATLYGMQQAVAALAPSATRVLIDGNRCPALSVPAEALVGGDAREPAISAASILAKVARDSDMVMLDAQWPGYGFAQHKGYGTAAHRQALQRLGPCAAHRRSFAPVREALACGPQVQGTLELDSPTG